jgi:MarR family transcriptional regulator, transcriptional regulator for hemolysin
MPAKRQPKPRRGAPQAKPIGLVVADTAKRLSRAFDDALAQAGGSRPVWLVLLALKASPPETQRELAAVVERERVADNRRVQRVGLTPKGERTFLRLRDAAIAFDARLREGLEAGDVEHLRAALTRMEANVTSG